MTARKRGLGRGLSALLGESANLENADAPQTRAKAKPKTAPKPKNAGGSDGLQMLDIAQLVPSALQPRQSFDKAELQNLADSLARAGMVQPILARVLGDGKTAQYEIIAGERRWRAAQLAQLHRVPVLVRQLNDARALEVAIVENVQRSDLNPVEESAGYQKLMDEFGYTQADLARTIGKSRSHIGNMLRLIRASATLKAHLMAGRLSMGHARAVLGHPKADQLAAKIIADNLSVRAAEQLAANKKPRRASKSTKRKDANTRALEKTLAAHLGLRVAISDKNGKGDMRISYKNLQQLDALTKCLLKANGG